MSGPRRYGPHSQVPQPSEYQPRGREPLVPPGGSVQGHPGTGRLLTGIGLCAAVLLFGELVKSGPLSRFDLRIDQHSAAHDRTGALTALAKFATDIGKPETVGVGLMFLVPIILFLMRRRL